jgi:hypothetical protein
MRDFDVRVTWGLPGSVLTRTTIVRVMATTEDIAISVARRSTRFEGIPKWAKIKEVKLCARS